MPMREPTPKDLANKHGMTTVGGGTGRSYGERMAIEARRQQRAWARLDALFKEIDAMPVDPELEQDCVSWWAD